MPIDREGQINVERQRIQESDDFRGKKESLKLLNFLIDAYLSGVECKEINIAVELYGLSNYDPENNGIVRKNAGRLRDALKAFADSEQSKQSLVRISLPKGCYVLDISPNVPDGFIDFFGEEVVKHLDEAVILLQSDSIDKLMAPFVADPKQAIKAKPIHRTFKARTWVNRWDLEGAKSIQEELRRYGLGVPEISISEHHKLDQFKRHSPFQISMGLGFTDQTHFAFTDACEDWMRVTRELESGDAVSLHEKLKPQKPLKYFSKPAPSEAKDFFRLLPLKWSEKYLDQWLEGANGACAKDVHDYAIILRHTYRDEPRKLSFVVAGFTERGTAIAGIYLARNWPTIWEKYVQGKVDTPSRGDFLMFIAGPSRPESIEDWTEDPNLPAITPERLRDLIPCAWAERFEQ